MDNPQNLKIQNSINSPPFNPPAPSQVKIEPAPTDPSSNQMEIEQPQSTLKLVPDTLNKQSPMKLIKSSPNKQEITNSNFNQPEEHITIIFSSFKDAIRNADIPRLKEILRKFFCCLLILFFLNL